MMIEFNQEILDVIVKKIQHIEESLRELEKQVEELKAK